jgi:hypothetical protein
MPACVNARAGPKVPSVNTGAAKATEMRNWTQTPVRFFLNANVDLLTGAVGTMRWHRGRGDKAIKLNTGSFEYLSSLADGPILQAAYARSATMKQGFGTLQLLVNL